MYIMTTSQLSGLLKLSGKYIWNIILNKQKIFKTAIKKNIPVEAQAKRYGIDSIPSFLR